MKMYFDIGANKGDYTENLLNSGADMVICVEPNIHQVMNLKRRFSSQNVTIINKAISNIIGPAIPFYICPECDVVSTCDEQWRTDSRFSQPDRTWLMQMVDVTTIDELIALFGIPVHIKLDVEGYEYKALLGMAKNYCQIRFEWAEEKGAELILSIKRLETLGYTTFGVMAGDTFHSIPDEFMDANDIVEFLNGKMDRSRKELWGMIFALSETDTYVC